MNKSIFETGRQCSPIPNKSYMTKKERKKYLKKLKQLDIFDIKESNKNKNVKKI